MQYSIAPMRLVFVVIFILGLLATSRPGDAQQAAPVAKLGYLSGSFEKGPRSVQHLFDVFVQELRERGWVEGQNLIIESRYAQGKSERLPALAAELVDLQVDVIFAPGVPRAQAARQATTNIPIVFAMLADPVAIGFVSSLAQPGGNITGSSGFAGELGGKWLELLREIVPGVSRVVLLTNPRSAHTRSIVQGIERGAQALQTHLHLVEIRNPGELEQFFATLSRERADALIVVPDPMFWLLRRQIADHAAKHRLPTLANMRAFVDAGGLISYGTTLVDIWRLAARYVDKILRGAKPGGLAIERPSKFELVINLKTANALGLTIPPTLLFQADEVIR